MSNQPMQPLYRDRHGVMRFKENAIARYIVDAGLCNLNKIALMPFSNEDRQQWAQLIGYSVDGYGELSYVDDAAYDAAVNQYSQHDVDRALHFGAEEWDNAIQNGLHEVGIPVSQILRSMVGDSKLEEK